MGTDATDATIADDATARRARGRRVIAVGLLLVALAVGLYARQRFDVDWSPEAVRELVQGFGFWGPLVFVLLVAFRLIFLIPSQVMLVAAGICFGLVEGTLYGALGVSLSGLIAFTLARFMGGERLIERVPENLRGLFDSAGRRGGAILVVVGTASPIGPMSAFHAGAGLTRMTYALFTAALLCGSLLRAATFSFLGHSIVEHGVLGAWPALIPLAVLLSPLLHRPTRTRVVGWLGGRMRGRPPPA